MSKTHELLTDPIKFKELCWPDLKFYDKQVEIIYSVKDNDETLVPAGNQLGKDFVSAFIALWFFCSRSPCRVVTSSVDQPQLKGVLWGEIRRFIQTSKYPLPVVVNDLMIRQKKGNSICPLSYLIGRVSAKGEGLLGHHIAKTSDGIPRTLALFDECSGVDNESYEASDTWAHRKLGIGNPYPCSNFFFRGVEDGPLKRPNGEGYYRNIIRIRGEDSPNVKLALAEKALGKEPSNKILIPGVLDYQTYVKRRTVWDKIRQAIGLDAIFYKGQEVLLFPIEHLNRSTGIHGSSRNLKKVLGVDVAEGGDNTVFIVADMKGIVAYKSIKTPDTSVIPTEIKLFMQTYHINPEDVFIDRGGGGKEHADQLRKQGYEVNTVGFGESAVNENASRRRLKSSQKKEAEQRYTYKNRRAQIYHLLSLLITSPEGWEIPPDFYQLKRQLSLIPKLYDEEGRLYLPPKSKKNKNSKQTTLTELIGHSPDEADAAALCAYGLLGKIKKTVGVL